MHDMPLVGLRNTQNLQVMQYRAADFSREGLEAYHCGDFRLRIPHCLTLKFISIMWYFFVCFCGFKKQNKNKTPHTKTPK